MPHESASDPKFPPDVVAWRALWGNWIWGLETYSLSALPPLTSPFQSHSTPFPPFLVFLRPFLWDQRHPRPSKPPQPRPLSPLRGHWSRGCRGCVHLPQEPSSRCYWARYRHALPHLHPDTSQREIHGAERASGGQNGCVALSCFAMRQAECLCGPE